MKKIIIVFAVLCTVVVAYGQKSWQLTSPNGEIKLKVAVSDKIQYDIAYGEETLLEKGTMQLQLGKLLLGVNPR